MKRTFLSLWHARNHARPEDSGPSNFWRLLLICNFPGLRAFLAATILLILPGLVSAQGILVSPRVTDRVDETRLAVLQGNTHPLARTQFDQGAAPPNLPMNRMLLVLKRGPDQEAALQDLLEQQQDTSSPNYHKWLTPDQFGQQFGPADADVQTVTSWLTSHGFQSIQVSKGRTVIEFSGTAAQVESALHTPIHQYLVNGENHWANASDPQIPAALAPVVSGVVTLHDFRKKPYLVRSGQTFAITSAPGERPQFRSSTGGNAMGPADFNVIYNVGASMTGAGATIGVIGRSNISIQDVRDFRTLFLPLVPANDPQIILNGPDPGDLLGIEEGEAVLDVSWSGGVAPLAAVKFVVSESTNATDGIDLSEFYIIDNNLADVMTESFGTCEAPLSGAQASAISGLAEQAAAQGITYAVSSGDNGAAGCDDQTISPATHAASVNVLASTPFTVAVGGTQFNENGNPSTYWSLSNVMPGFLSAKSYIPEDVWNESAGVAGGSGLWSSSGGKSGLFSKPSWQSGASLGIPADGARDVPDVSLTAAAHDPYLICIGGSCSGASPSFTGISGTSASVQAFGGVMGLVVQKTGARQGQANYVLYKLAAAETLASCNGSAPSIPLPGPCTFYDTTVGNNSVPVVAGFNAGVGYDLATGLGSVNVTNLVNKWSTAIVKGTTTTLSLATSPVTNPITLTHGQSVNVNIAVASNPVGGGTPTGDVSLIASSVTDQGVDGFTLNGSGLVNSNTTLLPGGPYTVKAHYAGDSNFLASDSSPAVSVTVNPEPSKTGFGIVVGSPCTTAMSVTYGSVYILSAAVTDNTGAGTVCLPAPVGATPTGTVTLTDGVNPLDGGSFKLNAFGYFEDQTIQLPAGPHNIKAVYAGDNSFSGSFSGPTLINVSKATTTTSMTSSKNGANVTLTATVDTQSNATANAQQEPNGTVQFLVGGVAFGSPVVVIGGVSSTTSFAQATAVLITATLPVGQSSITAQYAGDTNYSGSTSSAASVVVGADFSITASPLTQTISAGNPAGATLTITGSSGYAGTINFSASSCSSLPARSSCSFTPSSVTGSGSTVLTLSTTSAFLVPQSRPRNVAWPMAGVGAFALACILSMLVLFAPRRRLLPVSGFLMFACVALLCGGCKPSASSAGLGTPAGAYTITVTATGGGITHPVTFAVNVIL